MRKLNLSYFKGLGAVGAGSGLAFLYEEIAGAAVVDATARDNKMSGFDVLLQIVTGVGPLAVAGHFGGSFWAGFAGAMIHNRIDNVATVLGARALSPMGVVRKGETMAEAVARLTPG